MGLVVMLLRRHGTEVLVLDMERDMNGSKWEGGCLHSAYVGVEALPGLGNC